MGGKRSDERRIYYTTSISLYRTLSGADANAAAVTDTIDISGTEVGLGRLLVYAKGSIGDQIQVYVSDNDENWYFARQLDLSYDNELFNVFDIPGQLIKLVATVVGGTLEIREEHTL